MNQLTRIVLLACAGVSMWGQDAAAYLKQADTQAKAGQYRQAVASCRQGIALDPANSQAYMKLGDAYDRLNMPSEAATAYEKAADLMTAPPAAPAARQATPQPAAALGTQVAAYRPAPAGNGGGLNGLYFMTRF